MRRKSIYILILTFLGAIACSKVETFVDEGPDRPIDFSWYAAQSSAVQTKVDASHFISGSAHLPTNTRFGVFGYFHAQKEENGTPVEGGWEHSSGAYNAPNLFYNEPVTVGFNNGKYDYSYTNSRFWPKNTLDRISFFAYYPYYNGIADDDDNADQISATLEPLLDTRKERDGLVAFHLTVPTDPTQHVDFLVSDLCLDQNKMLWEQTNGATGLTIGTEESATAKSGTVKFFFHHALSQIRIRPVDLESTLSNNNVTVTLKSARFADVAVGGRCIPEADFSATTATGRTPVTVTWPKRFLSTLRSGEDVATGVSTRACYDAENHLIPENILLMIPQEFPDESAPAIEVTVDIIRWKDADQKVYEDDGVTPDPDYYYYYYSDNIYRVPLYSGVPAWLPGKIYTYKLSLSLLAIRVTAVEVDDWQTAVDDVFPEPVLNSTP